MRLTGYCAHFMTREYTLLDDWEPFLKKCSTWIEGLRIDFDQWWLMHTWFQPSMVALRYPQDLHYHEHRLHGGGILVSLVDYVASAVMKVQSAMCYDICEKQRIRCDKMTSSSAEKTPWCSRRESLSSSIRQQTSTTMILQFTCDLDIMIFRE